MAGTVKKLQFSEGTDVGAPTDLSLQTSTSVIKVYANDSAYAVDQAPANGAVYLNSTTDKFRMYIGSAWRNAVPESDMTDSTKTFLVDISGNTTAISATLKFAATGNRVYTFADATDDVVLRTVTQIMTNKELTAPLLENALIKGASKSLDVDTAAALAIGASVGAHNMTLGGSSSTVVIPGNLQVNGTTTDVETTNMQVKDANIQINQGGNDASGQGAGLTVKRTTTDGSLVYDSATTSKWKAGNIGVEIEIADISSAQAVSNKAITSSTIATSDIDGGTASNVSRLTIPKNTTTNLNALTRKQGTILFDTSTSEFKVDDGTSLNALSTQTQATATALGVVKGGTVPGQVSGSAIIAGSIGEKLTTVSTGNVNVTISGSYGTITSLSITAGVWMVYAIGTDQGQGAGGNSGGAYAISANAASVTGCTEGVDLIYFPTNAGSLLAVHIVRYINISTTTTYYFVARSIGAQNILNNAIMYAIRIG